MKLLIASVIAIVASPLTLEPTIMSFQKMDNGDFSVKGYGSVTEELQKNEISIEDSGEAKFKMFAENLEQDRCYVYIFDNVMSKDWEYISLSIGKDETGEFSNNFKSYPITKVSYNEENKHVKYLINNLKPSSSSLETHYYTLREFVKNDGKSVMKIASTYESIMGEDGLRYSQTSIERSVVISDKTTGYVLIDSSITGNKNTIDYYIAFNTPKELGDLGDLIEAVISYDYFEFTCITNIGWKIGEVLSHFQKNYKQFESCYSDGVEKKTEETNKIIAVEKKFDSYIYYKGFSKRSFSFPTIGKASEAQNVKDFVKDYDWIVHFSKLSIGLSNSTYGGLTEMRVKVYDAPNIDNATILTLTYDDHGEIKKYLAIDTYDTPQNQTPVKSFWDKVADFFKRCWKAIVHLFTGKFTLSDLPYFIATLILIPIATAVLAFGWKLIKWVCKPFRYLFKRKS